MISCTNCKAPSLQRIQGICGEVFGDEYIETYFRCEQCGMYTLEIYHDHFSGEDTILVRGPIVPSEAEARIALMRRCPSPSKEDCECAAHKEYFGR